MKKIKLLKALLCLALVVLACQVEDKHEPLLKDDGIPGPVQNLKFKPINGGFDVSYDLPKDLDILYVKAVYTNSQNQTTEVKVSVFDNKMKILGFGNTDTKKVTLYVVDRSENISQGVSFEGAPLESPIEIIKKTMEIVADFGGAKFTWLNALKTPISILLFALNEQGKLDYVKTIYSEQINGSTALRGYK